MSGYKPLDAWKQIANAFYIDESGQTKREFGVSLEVCNGRIQVLRYSLGQCAVCIHQVSGFGNSQLASISFRRASASLFASKALVKMITSEKARS